MSKNEKPTAAFILSLLAGIFILINGILLGFAGYFIAGLDISGLIGQFTPYIPPDAIQNIPDITGISAIVSTILYALMIVGIVFGALVLLGAIMVYVNPSHKTGWGVIILLFSILSIATGGGFLIGFILGIIGGALVLSWRPKTSTPPIK